MGSRFFSMFLLIGLTACSGPVRATNCEVLPNPKYGTVLRAMLANNTGKTVTHVGVLVGALEYEFPIHIEAHESTSTLVGLPLTDDAPGLLPIRQDIRGRVSEFSCWARAVDFADGSNWSSSPL